nr:permease [Bifidobacterium choloepi]
MAVIVAGYLFKRCGKFGPRDYRIVQEALFNLVLPCAIVYSFSTREHDLSLLWITLFGFVAAFLPVVIQYFASKRMPVANRAFFMLNASGFNIGCFVFPVAQAFFGPAAIVPAAMFDIGNSLMVAGGTNVMTQTMLHIKPGRTLGEQIEEEHADPEAPTLPRVRPHDRDARRLERVALLKNVVRGFVSSVPFDCYVVMVLFMVFGWHLPAAIVTAIEPLSDANAFLAMLMVGMLMELPSSKADVVAVLRVLGWRLPLGILFAVAAWFLLPFDPATREVVMLCCLAPIPVFSTLFTDQVIGNARLAGFTLSLTAVISLVLMTCVNLVVA